MLIEKLTQRCQHTLAKHSRALPIPPPKENSTHRTSQTKENMEKQRRIFPPPDTSKPLDEKGKKRVQQVVGIFLYYGRAVDSTILCALSEIASQQTAPTEKTMERVNTFLDYMATHPDAIIRYYPSDMILNVHSDTNYLTAPKARSRAGGIFS